MTHSDIPALTHALFSPSASESGLPVTPTPGSPVALPGGGGDFLSSPIASPNQSGNARPSIWGHKRSASDTSIGGPSGKKQCVDVDVDAEAEAQAISARLAAAPVRSIGYGRTRASRRALGELDRAVAVAVQEDADEDAEDEEQDDSADSVLGLRQLWSETPLRNSNNICTTFVVPPLRYDLWTDDWAEIHFHVQQYFVYYDYKLIDIWKTDHGRRARIHIVTPKVLVGVFEPTVKGIIKEVMGMKPTHPIRTERGQ